MSKAITLAKSPALFLFAILTMTLVAYWPGLGGGFVFDDYPNLVDNVPLHVTNLELRDWVSASLSSPSSRFQRPLAMLSFALNHYFTGLAPLPMKLTNVGIHLLNTILVFLLVRVIVKEVERAGDPSGTSASWVALFVSGFWALHPINLMAVLFVVQRMESFSHTFVFLGLLLYVVGRTAEMANSRRWVFILAGLIGATSLGLLVKESAVLIPLYAFLLEICILRFVPPLKRVGWALVVLLAVPAILGLVWLVPYVLNDATFSGREFSLSERLLTEPRVLFDYLRWILWPDLGQLSLYHDDYRISRSILNPPSSLFAILGLFVLALSAWLLRKRRPLASLGVLWFLGAHSLTATILPLELVFEHRNYFASLGIVVAAADLLLRTPRSPDLRRLSMTVGAGIMLCLGGLTFLRASEWRNPLSFAVTEAAKHPESPRATYYLGWMLSQLSGNDARSPFVPAALEAFSRARSLPRSNILPDQGALVLAARTGMPLEAEWWRHMQERLKNRPIGPQEHGALGGLMKCSIDPKCMLPADEMLRTFGAALSQGPDAEILSIYGNYVLNALGEEELALRLWEEAARLDPSEPQYRIGVIKLLIKQQKYAQAEQLIIELQGLGNLGQHAGMASMLQKRLESSRRSDGEAH